MEMGNRFAAVATIINDEAEALVGRVHPEFRSDFSRDKKKMAEEVAVPRLGLSHSWDGLARDDENMGRSLGIDIVKGDCEIVFVDKVRGNLPGNDFFEQGHQLRGETALRGDHKSEIGAHQGDPVPYLIYEVGDLALQNLTATRPFFSRDEATNTIA